MNKWHIIHVKVMTFNDPVLSFRQEIAKQKLPKDEFTRELVLSSTRSDPGITPV